MGMSVVLFALFLCCTPLSLGSDKPNIVLLFADDLGYGDLGVYGHPTSDTPNLNQFAEEGLILTQFYSASPVCSPSRAALLTGRYQTRSGIWPGVFGAASKGGLPHNETTIAEILKDQGYKSAIVGKWHLGVGENTTYLPHNQGFDYYLGIPYSHDMCPTVICFYPNGKCLEGNRAGDSPCPIYENTKILQQPADMTTLAERYSSAATGFIKDNAGKNPFFLYMAFSHTHKPNFASKMFVNTTIRGPFGDSLSELDWEVGQIIDTLKQEGVANNTFVFFTADNGPSLHKASLGGNGGLLRCGKGTTWEGGQREPAIAWWPGKIKPGRSPALSATVDMLPTVASLTGAKLPDVTLDGMDMSPFLLDGKPSSRDYYIYYPKNPNPKSGIFAIRWKQYKLHFYQEGSHCLDTYPDVVCRSNYSMRALDPPSLYDLVNDPSEAYPLSNSQYSDVIDSIMKLKSQFESKMIWGKSQIDEGSSSSVMPCASPGCKPFPSCCKTPTNDHWSNDMWKGSSNANRQR